MKGILSKIFIFAVGAGVGSAVTCFVLKNRYEQIMKEEAASIKEELSKLYNRGPHHNKTKKQPEENKKEIEKPNVNLDVKEYADGLKGLGYVNYSDKNAKKDAEVNDVEKPYVITAEEFGELYEYETNTLTYYADGVLTDDQDYIIDEPDEIVGSDFADHFGKCKDDPDTVYVRNDKLRCDYEILLDNSTYSGIDE